MTAVPPPESRPSLLLVDDDAVFRERLARAFRERGYDVHTAGSADDALRLASHDTPELAVVDLRMPGKSGLELVRDLVALDPATKIIVLTGYGSIATAVDAMKLGAAHYLAKPADADDLIAAFERTDPLVATATDYAAPSFIASTAVAMLP